MMGDQGELERRTAAHLQVQGAVGREGKGRTKYSGRLPRGLHDDMMESIALGRAHLRLIDFSFPYGIGDQVDGLPDEDAIECTDYTELPPEQLLLPPGEEAEDE